MSTSLVVIFCHNFSVMLLNDNEVQIIVILLIDSSKYRDETEDSHRSKHSLIFIILYFL